MEEIDVKIYVISEFTKRRYYDKIYEDTYFMLLKCITKCQTNTQITYI